MRFYTEELVCVFLNFSFIYRLALCPSLPAFCLPHSKEPLNVTYGKANTHTHADTQKSQQQADRNTHTGSATIMEAGVWSGKGGVYGALSNYGIICMHTRTHTKHTMCYVGFF